MNFVNDEARHVAPPRRASPAVLARLPCLPVQSTHDRNGHQTLPRCHRCDITLASVCHGKSVAMPPSPPGERLRTRTSFSRTTRTIGTSSWATAALGARL